MVEQRRGSPSVRPSPQADEAGAGGSRAAKLARHASHVRWMHRHRRWLQAVGVSLLCHVVTVPYGLTRLLLDKPQEIEIAYLADETPEAPLPPETPPPPEAPPPDKKPEPDKKKPEQDEPPEPDKRAEKKPEPKPEEKPKEPEPLLVTPMPHLKMVDQEQFPDEEDNAAAKFLAQKNHRAEKETRAEQTNLVLQQAGELMASEPSNAGENIGEKQKKVAELQDQAGDPKRIATGAPPGIEAPASVPQPAVAPLAMRAPEMQTPQSTAPERPLDPDGLAVQQATPGPLDQRTQGKTAVAQGQPGDPSASPFRLNHHDYDRVVGFDVAEAERRAAALAQRSSNVGHWDKLMQKQALMRATFENFTPNVRPGNQSELGTRKHPFAAFIATMHRQIHKFWGDGFLANLDAHNDTTYPMSLATAVEISLTDDGALDGMIISGSSGNGIFDAAALSAVVSAAPFPAPPRAIKSRDGKVYVTWRFHRDDRQCATDFVDAHILTTPPKPGQPASPQVPAKPGAPLVASSEAGSTAGVAPRLFPSASGGPPSNLPSTATLLGLKPLTGAGGGGASSGAGAGSGGASAPKAPGPAKAATAATVSDAAREAADRWLTAYQKSDLRWLAAASALPFTAGGKTVAEDKSTMRAFYEEMLSEGVPKSERVTYYTQGQILQRLGHLPRGADEDDMMFAWVELSGEDLILILQPADRGWSVVGIDRPTSGSSGAQAHRK